MNTSYKKVKATELATKTGTYIDLARTEPVVIEKSGKEVAVIVSKAHFDHLMALEDAYWLKRAEEARRGGFLGVEGSAEFLKELINEETQSK